MPPSVRKYHALRRHSWRGADGDCSEPFTGSKNATRSPSPLATVPAQFLRLSAQLPRVGGTRAFGPCRVGRLARHGHPPVWFYARASSSVAVRLVREFPWAQVTRAPFEALPLRHKT
jgi:hypothetical protein